MAEVDLEQIEAKRKEMLAKAIALSAEKDGDRLVKMAEALQKDAKQLDALTKLYGKQIEDMQPEQPPRPKPPTKIRLNDDQRKRVFEATGVELDVVEVPDENRAYHNIMPYEEPPNVEALAFKQAMKKKANQEAQAANAVQLAKAIDAINALDNPDAKAQLEKAMKEPGFLAGTAGKK
ncbi:MAG: hypothetical protein KC561_18610 [Myxococcales bacterium]|nr:hypothetical protein [Myxococcales bacterium]